MDMIDHDIILEEAERLASFRRDTSKKGKQDNLEGETGE